MRPETPMVVALLPKMPTEDVLHLHREIAREASKRYRRTKKYQDNYAAGIAASRALGV